jgi:L-asparaginase
VGSELKVFMQSRKKRVLLLHTGGTFGMHVDEGTQQVHHSHSGYLSELLRRVPELESLADLDLRILCNVDSSDMRYAIWKNLAEVIEQNWADFDGFVVVHGTDTMAYTATALSFFMKGVTKPIVLTGSQRPLSVLRSDARLNIIDSVELATLGVPEIMICFDSKVHRGTRVTKFSSEHMQAFRGHNSHSLGNFGVHFRMNKRSLKRRAAVSRQARPSLDCRANDNIIALDCLPGMNLSELVIDAIVNSVSGIVIRGFGSGNLPIEGSSWISLCEKAFAREIPVVMGTQCSAGHVSLTAYENGRAFVERGVISGHDMSFESLSVKLMVLLGRKIPFAERHQFFATPLAGECIPVDDSI